MISWKEYRGKQLNLKSNDPYDIRLNKLNLMSLQKRRLLTDVTFLFKVLNGNIHSYFHFGLRTFFKKKTMPELMS